MRLTELTFTVCSIFAICLYFYFVSCYRSLPQEEGRFGTQILRSAQDDKRGLRMTSEGSG